ncbi:cell division protein DivIB [Levilactobacillus zymae]|uniref:Cell division protein DivIB n=1 Tax=Levilactobacillus zymae TaxID=267363 RepID=A0ABQ0X021_9LACO|nr:FtsQ-type POTRA domain-containing protein [Levilactobacillus zymae]KRL12299.1 cell division septal protein [Levilactobacillus zymae DSM 19395]QFR60924.1 FtsQ-type POTRA domain-containing protein [Levilactobacillus zymae]GEO73235.1 cell division protein DivIB [Levilactobacillus zymae]
MKFRLNRKQSQQPKTRDLTPWEAYQSRAAQRRKQAQTPKWFRRAKRIGDKLPRLRHQRNRKLARRLTLLLSIFLVVIGLMVYLVSPLSHVQTVRVQGAHALSARQVQRAVGVSTGDSIFKVWGHEKKLQQQALRHNSRLKHATVQFHQPNRVTVRVVEYITAGYVMRQGQYYEVLENGIVSQQSVTQPKSGTPVYGNFKSAKTLHRMILQYAQLSTPIKHSISEIQASPTKTNPQRVHLFMNDGNEVYASLNTFARKMAYYPSIASKMKQKGVVNLEVGAYSYAFKK